MIKVGDLILCRGTYIGLVIAAESGNYDNDDWIQVWWQDGRTTWEELEPSMEVFEVINEKR